MENISILRGNVVVVVGEFGEYESKRVKILYSLNGSLFVMLTSVVEPFPLWIGFTMVGAVVRCTPFDTMLVAFSAGFADIATKLRSELLNLKSREKKNWI